MAGDNLPDTQQSQIHVCVVDSQVDHALDSLIKSMKWDEEVGVAGQEGGWVTGTGEPAQPPTNAHLERPCNL
jgi:hypothetical protein